MADRRPFSVEHSPLAQLILTRAREYYREPASVFWAFGFPVLLAVALGIAFKTRGPEPIAIAVEATADPSAGDALVATLRRASDGSLSARLLAPVAAREALRTGKVALVVVAPASPDQPYTYRADPTRPQSRLARALTDDALQSAAGRPQPLATRTE